MNDEEILSENPGLIEDRNALAEKYDWYSAIGTAWDKREFRNYCTEAKLDYYDRIFSSDHPDNFRNKDKFVWGVTIASYGEIFIDFDWDGDLHLLDDQEQAEEYEKELEAKGK